MPWPPAHIARGRGSREHCDAGHPAIRRDPHLSLENVTDHLSAGDFSQWLRAMRRALAGDGGMDVACGACRGCCVSAYYVKVRDHETAAIASIGVEKLQP